MQRTRTRKLVFGALLTALAVVLKSFLGIPVSMFGGLIKDINFSASIVMYAGIALGPIYGAIVGALTDILCSIIRPLGAYMPLFTLTNALMGLLPALFFLKNKQHGFWKTLLAVSSGQIVCSFICNTLILIYSIGMPSSVAWFRSISTFILIPVHTALIFALLKSTEKFLSQNLALQSPPKQQADAQ